MTKRAQAKSERRWEEEQKRNREKEVKREEKEQAKFLAGPVLHPINNSPYYEIDWFRVRRMARIHCTPAECAWVLGVPYSVLIARQEFTEVFQRGWEEGKASLRRLQWRAARIQSKVGNNVAMLIFLGKQILGQRDEVFMDAVHHIPGLEQPRQQDLKRLTVEELLNLEKLIAKAEGHAEDSPPAKVFPQVTIADDEEPIEAPVEVLDLELAVAPGEATAEPAAEPA